MVAGVKERTSLITTAAWATWLSPVVAGLVLAFASGGYFTRDWGAASVALLAVLAAAALTMRVSLGGRLGIVALSGFAGLAGWQGISSAWALQPSAAIEAMNRTLLYTAAFALGNRTRVNRDVTGSKRTSAFAPKSLSQTLSRSST